MNQPNRADPLEHALFAAFEVLEREVAALRAQCLSDVAGVRAGMDRRTSVWSVTTDVERAADAVKDTFNTVMQALQPDSDA